MTYKEMIDRLTKEEALILVKECSSYSQILRKMGMASVSGARIELLTKKLKQLNILIAYDRYRKVYNKNVNSNIFKKIDSVEKAYWLGFLAADGHIPQKSTKVRLHLSVKDEDHLDSFIKFIGGDLHSKYYPKSSKNPSVMFTLCNKEMSIDIKKHGLVSPKLNKNLFIKFKDDKLTLAYLLGYYDGDGDSGSPTITCGNKKNIIIYQKIF